MDITTALISTGVGAASLKGAKDFLSKLLRAPTEEAGSFLQDRVREYRLHNQIRALGRTQEMLSEAEIEPSVVDLRLLCPLLDGASIEDDERMNDRWAALLANAANPDGEKEIFPSFPTVLSQLSPADARLLDVLYAAQLDSPGGLFIGDDEQGIKTAEALQVGYNRLILGVQNIRRLGLISESVKFRDKQYQFPEGGYTARLNDFGEAFVRSCQPPAGMEHDYNFEHVDDEREE